MIRRRAPLAAALPGRTEDGRTGTGQRALPNQEALPEAGGARLAAVHDAVGRDIGIMVDAHWRFSPGGVALPAAPGLGSAPDEAGARQTPWQPMPKPRRDPRAR